MAEDRPTRLTAADLSSPSVEAYLQEQTARSRALPDIPQQPLILRVIYANYFYLSVAGVVGALIVWAILEPFINEESLKARLEAGENPLMVILPLLITFPAVAAGVGVAIGAAEGLMARNFGRAAISAVVGLGVGFAAGIVLICPTGLVFGLLAALARHISGVGEDEAPHGLGMAVFIMARGAGWAVAAIAAGIGQGIAVRERKVFLNGFLGALLGGLIGGLLFEPIALLMGDTETAGASRAIGFAVVGLFVGLFVGLVEQWTKTAWLLMRVGPLAGKQFVLYKNPTVVGSSPKADIYIFKDSAIEPRHALLHNRGGRYEIEDLNTPDGTYVNGVAVTRQVLKAGDQIVLGKTVLEFALKEAR
jgi:hypothetical protein